jgi:hypothetical protein
MKAVQVRYVVQPEYAEQNKVNIRNVMDALKANPIDGMYYATFTLEDGRTFVHINIARDEETLSKLKNMKEFQEFRLALKASNPVSPPSQTNLNPVAVGFEV